MSEPEPASLRLVVPPRLAGERFDRALAALVPARTGAQLQKLVRRGRVRVDGRRVARSNFRLRGGETLVIRLSDGAPPAAAPELEFPRVEATWAVADKPPGMLTHPAGNPTGTSLSELAERRFGPLPSVDDDALRPGIVHRLDRETSGLVLVARSPEALDHLRGQFRARTVDKVYLALVHGSPDRESFEVDRALGPVAGQKDLQGPDPRGREALSAFRVLRRWTEYSLVECRPRTGRRHQLRVHLWCAGYPVVGDKLYRRGRGSQRPPGLNHHALHATRLAFDDPGGAQRITVEAPPHAALRQVLEALEGT